MIVIGPDSAEPGLLLLVCFFSLCKSRRWRDDFTRCVCERLLILSTTLGYAIMFPGRKSGFRAGCRPDSIRENLKICLPAGRRHDFKPFPTRLKPKSNSAARFRARKHYRCLRNTRLSEPFWGHGRHKPYEFIGFGDMHGPKPYEFIGSRFKSHICFEIGLF